jgi:hypothetical protein
LASGAALVSPASAQAVAGPGRPAYHYLPATAETVHWGYFSKLLPPRVEIDSGDYITIEALTHHANDDAERIIRAIPAPKACFCGRATRRTSIAAAPSRWMESCSVADQARVSVSTSAPARSSSAEPNLAIFLRCALST